MLPVLGRTSACQSCSHAVIFRLGTALEVPWLMVLSPASCVHWDWHCCQSAGADSVKHPMKCHRSGSGGRSGGGSASASKPPATAEPPLATIAAAMVLQSLDPANATRKVSPTVQRGL